jgi:hypothetical protein
MFSRLYCRRSDFSILSARRLRPCLALHEETLHVHTKLFEAICGETENHEEHAGLYMALEPERGDVTGNAAAQ